MDTRGKVACVLLLLGLVAGAGWSPAAHAESEAAATAASPREPASQASSGAEEPKDSPNQQALQLQKEAVQALREAAKAGSKGDQDGFARAAREVAKRIDQILASVSSLRQSDRETLTRTAAGLRARAESGPEGYSPDADLTALVDLGYRLRTPSTKVLFEGGFAKPGVEEPAYGGHATAVEPPKVQTAAPPSGDEARSPE